MIRTDNKIKIETSAEVYAVIKARHYDDLVVFGSYSAPEGSEFSNQCEMYTEWGFKHADLPLMALRTTWDKDPEISYKRINQVTKYWLFVIEQSNDD